MTKKLWQGRFAKNSSPLMERFNASIHVDKRLYKQDIRGSKAHALMLAKIGILTNIEFKKIQKGLDQIQNEIESGKFVFHDAQEDIHMAIESRLTQIIGETGKKLHTARSRNDQVATDFKMHTHESSSEISKKLIALVEIFLKLAQKHTNTILPGYTHLQRAQPVRLSHHLLAYCQMFLRDLQRFTNVQLSTTGCPLGSGALAGSPIPINRDLTARELGFGHPSWNSMDSVADRDFALDFLYAGSVLMLHLSRLSEELVLWSSQEFDFIKLPEDFCTGSSMMPQKINPDAPELIRGKTGRVYGNLLALLTTLKSLPLTYNKDMQEDKTPVFDTHDTLNLCLDVLIQMMPHVTFKKDKMLAATQAGFVLATDLADFLVQKGLPFREAHAAVGKIVQHCLKNKCYLEDLELNTLKLFSKLFDKSVFGILDVERSVEKRQSFGGPSLKSVKEQIKHIQSQIQLQKKLL